MTYVSPRLHPSYLGGLSRINRNPRGRPARCPQHAPRIFESGWLVPREWLYVGAIEDASRGQQICRHCSTNAKISSVGGSRCNTGFGNRNTAPQQVCDAASPSGENDGGLAASRGGLAAPAPGASSGLPPLKVPHLQPGSVAAS